MKNQDVATPGASQIDAEDKLDQALDELLDDEPDNEDIDNDDVSTTDEDDGNSTDDDTADPEDDPDDESGDDSEDEPEDEPSVEKVRTGMQRRIDKLTAKNKALEEKVSDAEAEADTQKGVAEKAQLSASTGIDPDYIDRVDADTVANTDRLQKIRLWCRTHLEDGYEGTGDNDPSFEPEAIKARMYEVEDELSELAPEARRIRRDAHSRMRADLELGRQVRVQREKKRRQLKAAAKKSAPKKLASQTSGRPETPSTGKKEGIDRKAYEAGGRTDESLIDSMGDDFFS